MYKWDKFQGIALPVNAALRAKKRCLGGPRTRKQLTQAVPTQTRPMSAAARALFANVCKNTQTAVLRHRYGTAASVGGVGVEPRRCGKLVGATAGRSWSV